jgi:hypothetical protein
MKPRHFANIIFSSAVVALALWLAAEHQTLRARTAEHGLLEQQVREMADLAARNEQLSNQLTAGSSPEPLPHDQFMELLRLRGEVGALKQKQTDLDKARKENQQSHAVLAQYLQTLSETNPVATADYWPRGSWTNAGYASPDAALQTTFWAGYNGDLTNMFASITDEMRTNLANEYKGQSNAEISVRLADETYNLASTQILNREVRDNNTVVLTVELEERNGFQTVPMVMKNVNGQWKLAGPEEPPADSQK